jgi:hypothetical protein
MTQPKPFIKPKTPPAPHGDPRPPFQAKGPMIEIPQPIIEKPGAVRQKKPTSNMTYPTQGSQPNHFVTSKLNSIKPVK